MYGSLIAGLCREISDDDVDPDIVAARNSMLAFTLRMRPDYEAAWFHRRIAAALDWFVAGVTPRLMLLMPPQHGKTELASRMLPPFILGKEPDTRIIAGSYGDELASRNNIDAQRVIDSDTYAEIFPGTRLAQRGRAGMRRLDAQSVKARRTAHFFEVVGRRGSYRSAGVGVGISGMPADVGIIDDPLKDRAAAESATVREALWQWYTGSFRPRARGRILIIQTRWHEDDLVGRLLRLAQEDPNADQWTVVRIPALAETLKEFPRDPADRREDGEPLWPSRFSAAEMASLKTTLGSYQFDGMYQQRPTDAAGTIFQRAWFNKLVDVGPGLDHPGIIRCRFWDAAGTEAAPGKRPDWTVGTLMARTMDGIWWVEDVIRGQWGSMDVDRIILQTAQLDGPRVIIREEREPGSSGKAVVEARARDLAGWDYKGEPTDENKLLRWRPFAAQAEAGMVRVLNRPWTRDWIEELVRVPGGLNDDQADSAAGAFLTIAKKPRMRKVEQKLAGF